jgi:hypothetical protein
MDVEETRGRRAGTPARPRDRRDRCFVTRDDCDDALMAAIAFFPQKARGQSHAQDLADFGEPLRDLIEGGRCEEPVGEAAKVNSLAMIFWHLATIGDDEERERSVRELVDGSGMFETEEDRHYFRLLARSMILRHRRMFPELHGEKGPEGADATRFR